MPRWYAARMSDQDFAEKAKLAFIVSAQCRETITAMDKKDSVTGYPAFARNYNALLKSAREVLSLDATISKTVAHLHEYNPGKEHGYAVDHHEIQADLPVLLSALHSFIAFYMPAQEKQKIGFQ